MTDDQIMNLRSYYHSLRGQLKIYEESGTSGIIEDPAVQVLIEELARLERDFPGLVPRFNPDRHISHRGDRNTYYMVSGIRSHLAVVLGKLETSLDSTRDAPVTQTRDFTFIREQGLRAVIERDYEEMQRAFIAKCWKSVIILAGGAIEAILTDLLLQYPSRACSAKSSPKEPDIRKWELAKLIDVAVELGLVNKGVERLSHSVREYRNLVHPGNELRNKLSVETEEAKIAIEVLHMVHRDLSK